MWSKKVEKKHQKNIQELASIFTKSGKKSGYRKTIKVATKSITSKTKEFSLRKPNTLERSRHVDFLQTVVLLPNNGTIGDLSIIEPLAEVMQVGEFSLRQFRLTSSNNVNNSKSLVSVSRNNNSFVSSSQQHMMNNFPNQSCSKPFRSIRV